MPRMPPSGVRISCVTVARKRDFAWLGGLGGVARPGRRLLGLAGAR